MQHECSSIMCQGGLTSDKMSFGQTSAGWSPAIQSHQFSHSVVSDSLRPHGLQHTRLPCPSPTPGASSNSCPSHQWCHPTISSSVVPFSSCLQSFTASVSFPMIWFFASSSQSIGGSASVSVRPMNIQNWFPLGLTVIWMGIKHLITGPKALLAPQQDLCGYRSVHSDAEITD